MTSLKPRPSTFPLRLSKPRMDWLRAEAKRLSLPITTVLSLVIDDARGIK